MKPQIKTIDLELTRTISAAPFEAFDGWLDPGCPGTPWSESAKHVLDARPDGLFYWLFVNSSGGKTPHYGRFTIVERPLMVQYTWMSPHTRGLESLVTVTFEPQGVDTLMRLRHEGLPDDDGGRGHEQGWGYFMGKFAGRFASQRA